MRNWNSVHERQLGTPSQQRLSRTSSNRPSINCGRRTWQVRFPIWTAFACAIFVSLVTAPSTLKSQDLRADIEEFRADYQSVTFRYSVPMSQRRMERMQILYQNWLDRLASVPFDQLSQDGKVDYVLFRHKLEYELAQLTLEHEKDLRIQALIPFHATIVQLAEGQEDIRPVEGRDAAEQLDALKHQVQELDRNLRDPEWMGRQNLTPTDGVRAARRVDELRRTMGRWYRFYEGYDPVFSWWNSSPHELASDALDSYADSIRRQIAGIDPNSQDQIVGEPIGDDALNAELAYAMIPYTADELIAIAEEQFAWCDEQMDLAASELGFEDWRDAQEYVKDQHVEPGQQPEMIRQLAIEAIAFLESRDLLTIPELCKEAWRMEMMSPERQRVSPYFLGGETIIVSYPTDTMSHPDKMMSMRGNNYHFSRATVQHELIPGHHLQGYMTKRFRPYRQSFRTPFWLEGWALYWEMRLWDLEFPETPEDRIGMLFWRKHRCARIIFSLSYHLGRMTPDECIDFLVERVGHERNNATAEVRRSIMGGYGPLYQAAYMLGGLQILALHEELVQSGRMSEREFHDRILQQNSIPIEMVRAALANIELQRDAVTSWRFND